MPAIALELITFHLAASALLFFCVNWIGEHAVDFGYTSTTLFEEPNESAALNFLIKTLAPTVFIVLLSALLVTYKLDKYRILIYLVAYYYYVMRFCAIFILQKQDLISWKKFLLHSIVGILIAKIAYDNLILPKKSLIPDLNSAGNEIWLAITGFLYAVANKVPVNNGTSTRRKNAYILRNYNDIRDKFGAQIDNMAPAPELKLAIYAILIFENYARPRNIRRLEKLIFWRQKTTGIMQIRSNQNFSDQASVEAGVRAIVDFWNFSEQDNEYTRCYEAIAFHNKDNDYILKVMSIMEILALRIDPQYKETWNTIFK